MTENQPPNPLAAPLSIPRPIPEINRLRLGFVPLTDCAPLVAAEVMELGKAYGLEIELRRQPSWAAVRDKLLSGELDAAHTLYGLPYGVQLGLGGPQADMAILMTLNRNGQAISGSNLLHALLARGLRLPEALKQLKRKAVFAQTFPTGTHSMWLNYWLAANGVDPLRDIESVALPPPQMADAMAHGEIDGFCAGEPWHSVAKAKGVSRMIIASGTIWNGHPEKALACRRDFAALYPNTARALIRTMLDACRWLEEPQNRRSATAWLAGLKYLGVLPELILPSLSLDQAQASSPMHFHGEGINAPKVSDGMWFLSQYRRWGMLKGHIDYQGVASHVSQSLLFMQAAGTAQDLGTSAPATLVDGVVWDGSNAAQYADGFAIGYRHEDAQAS